MTIDVTNIFTLHYTFEDSRKSQPGSVCGKTWFSDFSDRFMACIQIAANHVATTERMHSAKTKESVFASSACNACFANWKHASLACVCNKRWFMTGMETFTRVYDGLLFGAAANTRRLANVIRWNCAATVKCNDCLLPGCE